MGRYLTDGTAESLGILALARQKTFAAAGSAQTDATLVGHPLNLVTGASGTNGVVLTKAKVPGRTVEIYSSAATNALLVYPPVGGTINNGSTNASFSATARTPFIFTCTSADGLTWIAK